MNECRYCNGELEEGLTNTTLDGCDGDIYLYCTKCDWSEID